MNTKTKWYFIGTCVIIIIVSIITARYISNSQIFTINFFQRTIKYVQYKIQYRTLLTSEPKKDSQKKAESIPILLYHGIPDISDDTTNIPLTTFEDHLFTLKKAGYTTIGMDDLLKFLRGEITLPEKSVLLTFDDGRIDSFSFVDPLLKALNYKAVMFVIGKYSLTKTNDESNYYLSTKDLRSMLASNRWEIQAHSFDGHGTYQTNQSIKDGHFYSHKIWLPIENRIETDEEFKERISNDLIHSKEVIKKTLKVDPIGFAFPFGDYGQNLTNYEKAKDTVVQEITKIYPLVFYQNTPGQRYTSVYFDESKNNQPSYLLKRFNMNANISGDDLLIMLQNSEAKTLPFSDNFSANKGWIPTWGDISITKNNLIISAKQNENGASAILDGSRYWKNYEVSSLVISPFNRNVYQWIRYQDDNNNAACNFGNGFVHIEQTINGVKSVIRGVRDPSITLPTGEFTIESKVTDRTVECSINGNVIVKTDFIDPSLSRGGIGFKTWSNVNNKNNLIIKSLQVTSL